jgi:hypothetical protein
MPCRVAATPYPAYEIIVQSLVNAGWHYVYPAYKNTVMPSGNAGWHYVYPAYKTTVLPSGIAGWRSRLSGLQNHRAAIGNCRMALTLIRPTKLCSQPS